MWIRQRGRADYAGWKLYLRSKEVEMYVGHPLATCVFWWLMWKVRILRDAPICGDLLEVRICSPSAPHERP